VIGPASHATIVAAIVRKDLREFSRDRLWLILTPLSMAFVVGAFWFLPDRVDETVTVGFHPPALAELLESMGGRGETAARGIEAVPFDSEERLIAAVSGELEDGKTFRVSIGIAFPDDFVEAIRAGGKTSVSLYVAAAVPAEMRRALSSVLREIAYGLQAAAAGTNPARALPVTWPGEQTIVLGEDRAGARVPLREKLRPMMAVIILMIEALALAGLVAVEIEHRTVTALLATPAGTADFLAAKGITGAVLGVSQVLVFLLATQSFGSNWLLVTVLMLLGAAMMSAVGMIAGAAGKDFMGTLFISMALVIPLMIPAFAILFPGSPSPWVLVLPSHGLVEAMAGAVGRGEGWRDAAPHIGATLAWVAVLFCAALLILKRRVEAL